MMAVEILGFIAPITPIIRSMVGSCRFRNDLCAGFPRSFEVRLHVVDVDHHTLSVCSANRPWTLSKIPLFAADHNDAFAEHQFGMRDAAIVGFDLQTDFKPECVAE